MHLECPASAEHASWGAGPARRAVHGAHVRGPDPGGSFSCRPGGAALIGAQAQGCGRQAGVPAASASQPPSRRQLLLSSTIQGVGRRCWPGKAVAASLLLPGQQHCARFSRAAPLQVRLAGGPQTQPEPCAGAGDAWAWHCSRRLGVQCAAQGGPAGVRSSSQSPAAQPGQHLSPASTLHTSCAMLPAACRSHALPAVCAMACWRWACVQASDVQHMMNLADSMVAAGVQPDHTTWSVLREAAQVLRHPELQAAVRAHPPRAEPTPPDNAVLLLCV